MLTSSRRPLVALLAFTLVLACTAVTAEEKEEPPLANPRELRFELIDSKYFVGMHYDLELRRLTVALVGGIIRTHMDVPVELVQEFRGCRLKGGFYKGRILYKYIAAKDQTLLGPVPMAPTR